MMKKYLLLLMVSVLSIASSCEEKDAQLKVDVIENSSPDITHMGYFSPTIGFGYKEYHIYTDFSASELKLRCKKCGRIDMDIELRKPHTSEAGGDTSIEATPEETGIYVALSEGNVITVKFARLEISDAPYGYYGTVRIYGRIGGKDKQTTININRRNNSLDEVR